MKHYLQSVDEVFSNVASSETGLTESEAAARLEKNGKKVIFCGDGVLAYGEYIDSKNNPLWCVAPQHLSMQKASSLCYAAYKRAQKGDFDNLYTLAPLYLRRSQAERELDAKRQVEAASNS